MSEPNLDRAEPVPPGERTHPGPARRAPRFSFDSRSSRLAAPEAPDYLSEAKLFRRSSVRPIGESVGQPLDSRMSWFLGNSFAFYTLESNSCVEVVRTEQDALADMQDGIDGVVIDHVIEGTYELEAGERVLSLTAGALGMFQTRGLTARSRHARMGSLFLPRTRILERIGGGVMAPAFALRDLSTAPLAPFLAAQIALLFKFIGRIDTASFEQAALRATDLAHDLLQNEVAQETRAHLAPSGPLARALRFMQENYRSVSLRPEQVGKAVGLSRAALYRLFAENGLTVAAYLRDVRLHAFIELLRADDTQPIERLAWHCGFSAPPGDFARLFQRLYGLTPSQARAALHTSGGPTGKEAA